MGNRYQIGEVFVSIRQEEAMERLEKESERLKDSISEYESKIEDIEYEMKTLKGLLYGKFGKTINLES